MRRHLLITGLTAAVLLLTGCGGQADDPDETGGSDVGSDDTVADEDGDDAEADGDDTSPDDGELPGDDGEAPSDDPAAGGSEALLGAEVQVAIDDVTERAGVDREDVLVEVTELVTWPDGSLGCPEPDQMYTQALVEGYRIVLSADGEQWAYHGEQGGDPSYCADPQPPA